MYFITLAGTPPAMARAGTSFFPPPPCRYDSVVSNGHARQDGGMCAYPYTFSDMDGRMIKVLTVVGGKAVI